jgi:hypothetical protein
VSCRRRCLKNFAEENTGVVNTKEEHYGSPAPAVTAECNPASHSRPQDGCL